MALSFLRLLPPLLLALVWTLGAGIAVLHLRTHPTAAAAGLLGAGLLLLAAAGHALLPMVWETLGLDYAVMSVVYALAALLEAGGVALLLAAAFLERP